MKSIFTKFIFILIMGICQIHYMQAQLCLNGTIFLDANGIYLLTAEDVLTLELGSEYEVRISPAILDCDHLGDQAIEVNVVLEGDTIYHCTSHIFVDELAPPLIQCTGSLHVTLDGFGPHIFTFNELDNGSFDECSGLTYKIIPDRIGCGDISPKNVTLRITDASGNTTSCVSQVTWSDFPGPISNTIVCNSGLIFELEEGEELEIMADMILDAGPNYCPEYYNLTLLVNDVIQSEPILTIDDTNAVIQVIVQDPVSLNQCWSFVDVVGVSGCEFVFNVCDTECNSAPFGDCASGHTDQDDVEWPCDLTFTDVCQETQEYLSPEEITLLQQGDSLNSKPIMNECSAQFINMGYSDQVIPQAGGIRIVRTWTIIHWTTQVTASYIQNIYAFYRTTNICDTLAWNTPAGDCESGHTLSDDIEWPADITIESMFTHPDDLDLNPLVLPQNVRPQILSDCNTMTVSFQDFVTRINDSILITERTWSAIDFNETETWQFVQRITSLEHFEGSLVCVMRENGEPIPDVELIPGVFTDATGCYNFTNPAGITVIPVKDSPWPDGVNLLDKILLREHILGIITLSDYQVEAGDLSNTSSGGLGGGLSTLDMVILDRIINGTYVPQFPHNWRFFERMTNDTFADISDTNKAYKFIGIKMGDIDNSYALTPPIRENSFLKANDEILNSGETYLVPFYPDRTEYISGYSIRIKNETNSIEFLGAEAINLPGFFPAESVTFTDDGISIIYVASGPEGAFINELEPLFVLEIKANADVVLHEELALESSYDNILKPTGNTQPLDLKFEWENVIISKVTTLDGLRAVEFFPNPVTDVIHLKGLATEESGTVHITDASGRIIQHTALSNTIDLSVLHAGMYYISFIIDGKQTSASPLIMMK